MKWCHLDKEIFFCEVYSASYLPHRMLFSDVAEDTLERAGFAGSNIYYLTRTKRIRFCPIAPTISSNGLLSVSIASSGSTPKEIQLPLDKVYPFNSHGLSATEIVEAFNPQFSLGDDSTAILASISSGDQSCELVIAIENIIAATNIDFGTPPEILYIGQTSDMLRRWRTHKQINHATSLLAARGESRD